MSTALNPAVTPLLAYAVVALLVIFSFVAGILVILTKVRVWLKELFVEFSKSEQFEQAAERLLTRISERMNAPLVSRLATVEVRDIARAKAVTRGHRRTDRLNERIDHLHLEIVDLYKRLPPLSKETVP